MSVDIAGYRVALRALRAMFQRVTTRDELDDAVLLYRNVRARGAEAGLFSRPIRARLNSATRQVGRLDHLNDSPSVDAALFVTGVDIMIEAAGDASNA